MYGGENMLEFDFKMTIKSKELFYRFIQKNTYELFLIDLINNNSYFNMKKFEIIKQQPNGQDDFICVDDSKIKMKLQY